MKVDTLPAVICVFLFLLPGFVWSAVYAMLIRRKPDTEQIRFMEFFTLSCVNNAFWSWAIYLVYRRHFYERHELVTALLVFVIAFLSPTVAGLVTANVRQRRWSALFLNWLGFRTVLRETTAWDFKLSETRPVWVSVLLKNGDTVFGLFGDASFAGDAGSTADLYLEETLVLQGEDVLSKNTANQGVWIASDQIATIEFVGDDHVS